MEKNLYKILEISKDSTIGEVKKAYAKMLRKYPPEKFNKEFSVINSAYEILGNEEKRYEYDQLNGYEERSQFMLDEGLNFLESGNSAEGKKKLCSFVQLEGKVPYVMHEIGKVYAMQGDYKRAYDIQKDIMEKEKFITFDQMDYMIYYLYKLNDEENLLSYMKKAILKFRNVKTYFNLIEHYIDDKKYDKAKELLLKNALPFLRKKGDIENINLAAKLLFELKEDKIGAEYLIEAIGFKSEEFNDIAEKLEVIKKIVVDVLEFKNANLMEDVVERQLEYINETRKHIGNSVYMDNIGWATISLNLIKDLAFIDKNNFHPTLKKFLLASVKKRISVEVEIRESMDEDLINYLEKLKEEYDVKKIKENISLLEQFHQEIYNLDAKYLFDKYGGFIPYSREIKNKKRRDSRGKAQTRKKGKKASNKSSGTLIFICLGIIIIVALIRFI